MILFLAYMVSAGAERNSEYGSSISLEARSVALNAIEDVIGQLETQALMHRLCIDTFRPFGEALGIGTYTYMLDQTAAKITKKGIIERELLKGDCKRDYYYVTSEGLTVLTLMGYEVTQEIIAGRLKLHRSVPGTYFQLQALSIKHWLNGEQRSDLAKSIHENTQGIKLSTLPAKSSTVDLPKKNNPPKRLDQATLSREELKSKRKIVKIKVWRKPLPTSEPKDLRSRLIAIRNAIVLMEFPPEKRLSEQEKRDIKMGLLLAKIMDETGCHVQVVAKALNIDPNRANILVNELQDRPDHLELIGLPFFGRRRPTKYSTNKKAV